MIWSIWFWKSKTMWQWLEGLVVLATTDRLTNGQTAPNLPFRCSDKILKSTIGGWKWQLIRVEDSPPSETTLELPKSFGGRRSTNVWLRLNIPISFNWCFFICVLPLFWISQYSQYQVHKSPCNWKYHRQLCNEIFIRPRQTWGPIYGSGCHSLQDDLQT